MGDKNSLYNGYELLSYFQKVEGMIRKDEEGYDFFTKQWDENILEEVVVEQHTDKKDKKDSKDIKSGKEKDEKSVKKTEDESDIEAKEDDDQEDDFQTADEGEEDENDDNDKKKLLSKFYIGN